LNATKTESDETKKAEKRKGAFSDLFNPGFQAGL
jgi:hypothetical protein